jgi:hypothetical protein
MFKMSITSSSALLTTTCYRLADILYNERHKWIQEECLWECKKNVESSVIGNSSSKSLTLKVTVINSSKILVTAYKTAWCHNPDGHALLKVVFMAKRN